MLVFAVETSCDETSVAILRDNKEILSHIVVNQFQHSEFGGVVPEIASRAHLQILQKITPKAFRKAGISVNDIDIFCATCGPGLIGGLLVGSTFVKSLALALKKPFFPINHLEGHLLSPTFNNSINFPCLSILLTGGHTQIYLIKSIGEYVLLGETIDDAVGESFDKVAKILGLHYPGGPKIEQHAKKGKINYFKLPHPMENKKNLNFSFSGIKTAVNLIVKNSKKIDTNFKNNMCASFQNKISNILDKRVKLAFEYLKKKNIKVDCVSVVGGVAINKFIRSNLSQICKNNKCSLVFPPKEMFGDNAAMIAWACINKYNINQKPDLFFKANPRLTVNENDL